MCSQVILQISIIWKILWTLIARKWFLTCVSSKFFKIPIMWERLCTQIAIVLILTCVYSQVSFQIAIFWESFLHKECKDMVSFNIQDYKQINKRKCCFVLSQNLIWFDLTCLKNIWNLIWFDLTYLNEHLDLIWFHVVDSKMVLRFDLNFEIYLRDLIWFELLKSLSDLIWFDLLK